jgi:hypothetical protein
MHEADDQMPGRYPRHEAGPHMKMVVLVAVALAVACGFGQVTAAAIAVPSGASTRVEHGGGCRKSSPPGQCCHMDRRTGVVHCH